LSGGWLVCVALKEKLIELEEIEDKTDDELFPENYGGSVIRCGFSHKLDD